MSSGMETLGIACNWEERDSFPSNAAMAWAFDDLEKTDVYAAVQEDTEKSRSWSSAKDRLVNQAGQSEGGYSQGDLWNAAKAIESVFEAARLSRLLRIREPVPQVVI